MYLKICRKAYFRFVVVRLSQNMETSTRALSTCIKCVLHYIAKTQMLEIIFNSLEAKAFSPVGLCDSDWAGFEVEGKATSGFVFLIARAADSWNSKKKPVLTKSIAEAAYLSLGSAVQKSVWLGRVFVFAREAFCFLRLSSTVAIRASLKLQKMTSVETVPGIST